MILMRKRGDDDIFLDCVGGAHKILKKKTEKKRIIDVGSFCHQNLHFFVSQGDRVVHS